jgi:hypothetical protein
LDLLVSSDDDEEEEEEELVRRTGVQMKDAMVVEEEGVANGDGASACGVDGRANGGGGDTDGDRTGEETDDEGTEPETWGDDKIDAPSVKVDDTPSVKGGGGGDGSSSSSTTTTTTTTSSPKRQGDRFKRKGKQGVAVLKKNKADGTRVAGAEKKVYVPKYMRKKTTGQSNEDKEKEQDRERNREKAQRAFDATTAKAELEEKQKAEERKRVREKAKEDKVAAAAAAVLAEERRACGEGATDDDEDDEDATDCDDCDGDEEEGEEGEGRVAMMQMLGKDGQVVEQRMPLKVGDEVKVSRLLNDSFSSLSPRVLLFYPTHTPSPSLTYPLPPSHTLSLSHIPSPSLTYPPSLSSLSLSLSPPPPPPVPLAASGRLVAMDLPSHRLYLHPPNIHLAEVYLAERDSALRLHAGPERLHLQASIH